MKKYYKIIMFSIMLLFVPTIVLAADSKEIFFLPEIVEEVLEIVNLVFAILAAVFAVKLAALSQGGDLEKTWNLMAMSAFAFAVVEVLGALKEFGLLQISGLTEIFELIFIILMTYTFYKTRKSLLKRVMGK
ncbi:MAG: hypothetical protein COY69_02005 [Candidatus Magasanikbacteria bacterium CG_4_10_14_0_8_um_filter_32_14]|uniref:DUF1622 domain-containing protein n=1 Tax=Candidatus Magasanikbacteria bacterium CG_4_10_14_0_8_um_filter_32_14 TaxID=1974640 RepID=A0A2M7RA53_9BACT|nr:MAG: hypothetical protein COY69_02005 [Candidatus Magasanikbacteria bacterium CG_4_10_14_0_8_um_filter_32_14]